MKNILLIGCDGYIGSKLKIELLTIGHRLTCVDLGVYNGDIISPKTIKMDYDDLGVKFLSEYDVIILLAGHSSVKSSEGDLIHSYTNNVQKFINLVSKINKNTKFIYASSSSVYGKCTTIADEKYSDFIPYNNYDITKHFIDIYIDRCDVEYYGLRFGTVNGFSPILRNDVMINAMYCNALKTGHIDLYIKHIMRPILGISDLSNSILKIIESEKDLRGTYNLASFNKSAEEIATEVGEILNVPVIVYAMKPTETITNSKLQTVCYDFQIDTDKFKTTFNFTFNETIKTIVDSLQNNVFIQTNRSEKLIL